MSTLAQDLIDGWQTDIVARLRTNTFLDDIFIIQERLGTTETEVEESLKLSKATGGFKPGIAIMVFQPSRGPTGAQTTLQWDLETIVRVIELPKINRKTGGSGKWASTVSLGIERVLHNWVVGSATARITKAGGYNDGEGGIGFTHLLGIRFGATMDPRAATPSITGNSSGITLVNHEAGAAVRYTVDGTLPTSTNGVTYSAPFIANVGDFIRATAAIAGKQESNVAEFEVKN